MKASPLGIRVHPPTSTVRGSRAGSRGTSLRQDWCQEAPGSCLQGAWPWAEIYLAVCERSM